MKIRSNSKEMKTIIIVFVLLFFSNDTYLFGTNSNELMVALPRYFMLLFCAVEGIISFSKNEYGRHKKIMGLYLLMTIIFLGVSYYHHEYFTRVLIKVLCMTTGMLICIKYNIKEYSNAFLKCMTFLSVAAILLTVLAYIAPSVVRSLPSIVNTVGVRFYSIGIAGLDERSLTTWNIRTGGIFWEPGVFQMYLNFAILLELMINRAANKTRMAVYLFALLLTFSTTGYLTFIWMVVTYALFEKNSNRSMSKNVAVFLGLIISAILLYFIIFYTNLGKAVFGKLFDIKDGSTMPRLASVLINLEIIKEHPFTGIGMDIMADEFERRSYLSSVIWGWTRQNTNTLLYQYSAHGCFFGVPFTWGTYKFGGRLSNRYFMKLSIFVLFLMLYIGENLMTSIFPYIIIYYGAETVTRNGQHKDIILGGYYLT